MEKMNLKYKKIVDEYGEYYLPDFGQFDEADNDNAVGDDADDDSKVNIGKYGHLRLDYLKNHRRVLYGRLIASGELHQYLIGVEREATDFFDRAVSELARARGITEELKANDQMKWVGLMNNVRAAVDEMIYAGIIYV